MMQGLHAVVDEQESLREQIRNNPESHERRRRSIRIALLLLPIVALCAFGAYQYKMEPIREFRPDGTPIIVIPPPTVPGTLFVITGELVLAFVLVLLIRSPFRMSPGERVFRAIWLGPIGRGFIHIGARGVVGTRRTPGRSPSRAITARAAPVRAHSPRPESTLTRLEARVAELEKWRDSDAERLSRIDAFNPESPP
jgi:hypothetical protein